jgi:hypothetical protein
LFVDNEGQIVCRESLGNRRDIFLNKADTGKHRVSVLEMSESLSLGESSSMVESGPQTSDADLELRYLRTVEQNELSSRLQWLRMLVTLSAIPATIF